MAGLGAAAAASSATASDQPAPRLGIAGLFTLKDKVAVLADIGGTGSREVALLLAAAGARIVVADRVMAPAKAMVAEIVAKGGRAEAIEANIEDEASVIALFQAVDKAAGRLDILVNCAGMVARQPFVETTVQQWDEVQSWNLRANFLCMREAVKLMLAGGRGGRIINITTIGALQPVLHGNAAYGAARLGVNALGRDVAFDHAKDGILVNTIHAGSITDKVPLHPTTIAAEKAGHGLRGPILEPGRLLLGRSNMNDVAAAVLYLATPASRYMTGQALVLDGGFFLS